MSPECVRHVSRSGVSYIVGGMLRFKSYFYAGSSGHVSKSIKIPQKYPRHNPDITHKPQTLPQILLYLGEAAVGGRQSWWRSRSGWSRSR